MEQVLKRPLTFWKPVRRLEIVITDFCNLDCPLCCQGTRFQKDKKIMSLKELGRISKLISPFEFDIVKISGGESTIHPQFGEICDKLKEIFPAYAYELATNGCLLEKFLDHLKVFSRIELSRYPGKNDSTFFHLTELEIANLHSSTKDDYSGMEDIYKESNLDKTHIYQSCKWTNIKKVVQSRIYPCCQIFGQSVRQNIDINKISVPLDENWRKNLVKINPEPYCRHCFSDVDTESHFRSVRKLCRNVYTLLKLFIQMRLSH